MVQIEQILMVQGVDSVAFQNSEGWCVAGKILYERVAELCPRHPGRSKKAQAAAAAAKQQAAAASSPAIGPSKSSSKSGKKKRK